MFKKTTAFRRLAKVITKSKCELIIIVSMLSETIVNHKGIKVVRMFFRTKSFNAWSQSVSWITFFDERHF